MAYLRRFALILEEKMLIWRYMVEQHHNNAAVITGSSTHNERVERLWRDVFRCVGCVGVLFYDKFQHLQVDGKLNPSMKLTCTFFIMFFCQESTKYLNHLSSPGITTRYPQNTTQLQISYFLKVHFNKLHLVDHLSQVEPVYLLAMTLYKFLGPHLLFVLF